MKFNILLLLIMHLFHIVLCLHNCKNDSLTFQLPEMNMTADEIIAYNKYPIEIHKVQTQDGYILQLQRIPHSPTTTILSNSRQPVLVQHGFVGSSVNWVINHPNQSLGFILADNGFDVWLGNIRGNSYSQGHVNYTIQNSEYWNFSWDEMAQYDLPAMINYIVNITGFEQIVYIGHSQGSLIGFARFSTDAELAKKIKTFVVMAPIATVGHITSPFRYVAPLTWTLQMGLHVTGDISFGDVKRYFRTTRAGYQLITGDNQCGNPFFFFSGPGSTLHLNKTRIPIYHAHNPDDTSMKNFAHFGQMVTSGLMQKYDYGFFTNYMTYGQFTPPEYHPENMDVDTVVFWSPDDALSSQRDVQILFGKLKKFRSFRIDSFRHNDFMLALDASVVVYPKIVEIIKS